MESFPEQWSIGFCITTRC